MRTSLVILAGVMAAMAGCVDTNGPSPDDGTDKVDVWGPIQQLLSGVPCEASSVGAGTSENLVGLSDLTFDDPGITGEIDIFDHYALMARYDSGGFEVVDIADPRDPVLVGQFTDMQGGLDVKATPDGQLALVGNSNGIVLVDIRDPTEPEQTGVWLFDDAPLPPRDGASQNAHMITVEEIADETWVFLAPNSNTGVWVLKLEGTPDEPTLTYVTQTLPVQGGPLGPHDMSVSFDADLDTWVLYSADGFHGWTAFDVGDPANPALLGGFVNPAEAGYTHSIEAAKIGDRRIVVTISEVGFNAMRVYDATDLLMPVPLAVWQASPGPGSVDPQHNLHILDGKLYVAYYGHGFYVFDLASIGARPLAGTLDIEPMAHWAGPGPGAVLEFPGYWEVVVKDGVLYASNIEKGLEVVGFGCNKPGDPLLTTTG